MAALADILVKKGGYNLADALNAEKGPRASELAKEFGAMPTATGTTGATGGLDWQSVLGQQRADRQAFNAGQAGQEADYLNRFRAAIGGQESAQALATRIGSELNLPTLRQNAFNLQQQVQQIPGLQIAATRGFDVNANQLARIINAKTAQLAPLAQTATAQQQFAEGQLGEQMGYAQQDQARQLAPFQVEQGMLADRLSREATGFSTDMENELTVYLNRLARGEALSDAENSRAQALADAEMTQKNALEKIKFQTDENIREAQAKAKATGSNIAKYLGGTTTSGGTGGTTNTGSTFQEDQPFDFGSYLGGIQSLSQPFNNNAYIPPKTYNFGKLPF